VIQIHTTPTPTNPAAINGPRIVPCKVCGKSMTPGRRRTRKYCSRACQQKAYRQREKVKVTA
jgi:hypothetical protein